MRGLASVVVQVSGLAALAVGLGAIGGALVAAIHGSGFANSIGYFVLGVGVVAVLLAGRSGSPSRRMGEGMFVVGPGSSVIPFSQGVLPQSPFGVVAAGVLTAGVGVAVLLLL